MRLLSSLSTRLVLVVLATAIIAFSALVGLTVLRLNQSLERQAEQLGMLSAEKLGQRLQSEARLAGARVEMLFADTTRALEGISRRADVVKAVASANVVEISELLHRAGEAADIDGIIVVDAKLRVFGADRMSVDVVATNSALQKHPIAQHIRPILAENDRRRPRIWTQTSAFDDDLAAAIAAQPAPLGFIAVQPIFDDFGDVFAGLIAYRAIRPSEARLEQFSQLDGAGLLVLDEHGVISTAGIQNRDVTVETVPGSILLRTTDGRFWSRCVALFGDWRICALTPVAELHAHRDELVRIGESEGRSLARWLVAIAVISLVCFALITMLAAQRISRQLAQITRAVRAVARGDWKARISGTNRSDEVGDIARAVLVLQRSLEERDRLRSDVAHAEEVKRRREELEDAIRRFDRIMRSVLLSVSDCVETMDDTARELARMSAVAEGEAVEAAFVSESTVSNVSMVRQATDRLSEAITETVDRIRQTADIILTSNQMAQLASTKAEQLAQTTREIDAVIHLIGDLAAQTNTVALNATIQAGRADTADEGFARVVMDIRALAQRIGKANDDITARMAVIRGATDEAVGSARTVATKLDSVMQQTKMIMLAMERQDAVTREIAGNMSAAANGTINVSSSVERLKTTIEEARGASMKVVTKATDMADEAHRLDSTVKSFLREVTA